MADRTVTVYLSRYALHGCQRFDCGIDYSLNSRDVDSYILDREVSAVFGWLNHSVKMFHVMRDSPRHKDRMLAGLWGSQPQKNFSKIIF